MTNRSPGETEKQEPCSLCLKPLPRVNDQKRIQTCRKTILAAPVAAQFQRPGPPSMKIAVSTVSCLINQQEKRMRLCGHMIILLDKCVCVSGRIG